MMDGEKDLKGKKVVAEEGAWQPCVAVALCCRSLRVLKIYDITPRGLEWILDFTEGRGAPKDQRRRLHEKE